METLELEGGNLSASRIGLGTGAIGAWMRGGTDAAASVRDSKRAESVAARGTGPVGPEFMAAPARAA